MDAIASQLTAPTDRSTLLSNETTMMRNHRTQQSKLVAILTAVAALAFAIQFHAEQQGALWLSPSPSSSEPSVNILPQEYDRDQIQKYWIRRPISIVHRMGQVGYELVPLAAGYVRDFYILNRNNSKREELLQFHAERLREALTNLGPTWVKVGQQFATRPDVLHPIVVKELEKLHDSVRPIPDELAFQVLRQELRVDNLKTIFEDLQLVAAASLGQVYKAKIVGGTSSNKNTDDPPPMVAIKVQRPRSRELFSLDLFLLRQVGGLVDSILSTVLNRKRFQTDHFLETFSHGSYLELDYQNEAQNQILFQKEFQERGIKVKIPDVYLDYSTEKILTTEWVNGLKMPELSKEKIIEFLPISIEVFWTQIFEIGTFHADPHPGNLLVTSVKKKKYNNNSTANSVVDVNYTVVEDEDEEEEQVLCLLDFGLCGKMAEKDQIAWTRLFLHLFAKNFDAIVENDMKAVGFLPEDFNPSEIKPLAGKLFKTIFLENAKKRNLMEITNDLYELSFESPIQLPPFIALVLRNLGILEGLALSVDPDFSVCKSITPHVNKKAASLFGETLFGLVTKQKAKD